MPRLVLLTALLLPAALSAAAPPITALASRDLSVEELTRAVRPSIVVTTVRGRDGKTEGMGTGFVVRSDGLIATNHPVIGEGRAITVEMADGSKHDVTTGHATD